MSNNILTPADAANFVRTESRDQIMLMLLPQVDTYLLQATGRDWAADTVIHPGAKAVAGMLLTYWYDNPQAIGTSPEGSSSAFLQLEMEAQKYRKSVFYGRNGVGAVSLPDAAIGDVIIKLVGVYGSTGSQSAKFEGTITVTGMIQQIDAGDLSENIYVVILKNPAEDITA